MYDSKTWAMKVNDMRRFKTSCEPGRGGRSWTTKMVQAYHMECKDLSDWVSAGRELQVEGTKGQGRGRMSWNECVPES